MKMISREKKAIFEQHKFRVYTKELCGMRRDTNVQFLGKF